MAFLTDNIFMVRKDGNFLLPGAAILIGVKEYNSDSPQESCTELLPLSVDVNLSVDVKINECN